MSKRGVHTMPVPVYGTMASSIQQIPGGYWVSASKLRAMALKSQRVWACCACNAWPCTGSYHSCSLHCHPRAGEDPGLQATVRWHWIPAFAGVTETKKGQFTFAKKKNSHFIFKMTAVSPNPLEDKKPNHQHGHRTCGDQSEVFFDKAFHGGTKLP